MICARQVDSGVYKKGRVPVMLERFFNESVRQYSDEGLVSVRMYGVGVGQATPLGCDATTPLRRRYVVVLGVPPPSDPVWTLLEEDLIFGGDLPGVRSDEASPCTEIVTVESADGCSEKRVLSACSVLEINMQDMRGITTSVMFDAGEVSERLSARARARRTPDRRVVVVYDVGYPAGSEAYERLVERVMSRVPPGMLADVASTAAEHPSMGGRV